MNETPPLTSESPWQPYLEHAGEFDKMSQQIRFIVDKLNEPPFSRKFNLVSFDALDSFNLLQALNDVLAEISPEHKIDLREEQPEQTAVRVLTLLRVLKYQPKSDQGGGLNTFRQGLLQGDKHTTYSLLQWLLERLPELKKRSYLAKFLIRIEVPAEFLQDEQIVELSSTHDELLERFKESHKTIEQQRASKFSVAEVRKDIAAMEEEKEQLGKRIERLKQKAMSTPNSAGMLEAAQKLRKEKDKALELEEQKLEQKNLLLHAEQKLELTRKEVEEAEKASFGLTADKLTSQLDDEIKLNKLLTEDTLPKKIEVKRKECIELERVHAEPIFNDSDLNETRQQIQDINQEITRLREEKMPGKDPAWDRLVLFRQQASIIARKKDAAVEDYKTVADDLAAAEKELQSKRDQLKDYDGGIMLREDEFKRYVAKLRTMNTEFKNKKAELSVFKAEFGVLARTEEILKSRDDNTLELMELIEKQKGVHGYRQAQEEIEDASAVKSELDEKTGRRLLDITATINELVAMIESKKASLAPLIKNVRPLRQQHQELQAEHVEKKTTYDGVAAGLQSQRSGLEREVRSLWEETLAEESRYHYLNCMLKSLDLEKEKIAAEMRCYVSSDPAEKRKSLRDAYTRKIQEAENSGKALRDKQKDTKECHESSLNQVKLWRDLKRIMEVKKESFLQSQQERSQAKAAEDKIMAEENRLVIT
jgi:intraflagellar transport protein 81